MLDITEGIISANHNYIINAMPIAGFVLGNPNRNKGFWFLADVINPEDELPLISGSLYNKKGEPFLEIYRNKVKKNPGNCIHYITPTGYGIKYPDEKELLTVETEHFANGHITYLSGEIYDHQGVLRMKSLPKSTQVYGTPFLILDKPFNFSKK